MRRPTRTRRLSTAAFVSLLLLVVVAGAGAISFREAEGWDFGRYRTIWLESGGILYQRFAGGPFSREIDKGGFVKQAPPKGVFLKFSEDDSTVQAPGGAFSIRTLVVVFPLWPLLLLLLIAPMRWLIARPANAPAFPVITDARKV